jgi:hypothetical protein
MALPSGPNQISFLDFQTENGFVYAPSETIPPTDMYTYALVYSVPFTIDGSNPISMDEFFNKEAPTYDVYEGFGATIEYSYVPYSSGNPFQASFNGTCASKLTYPGIKYGEVLTTYPSAVFYNAPGESCGEAP